MASPDSVISDKASMRRMALQARDTIPPGDRAAAAETVAARGLPVAVAPGAVISGFSPMRSEISPIPLMRRLFDAGAQLALPVVHGHGAPLLFRAWQFGDPLVAGVWGIREPGAEASPIDPDLLLVPLAAFDRRGYRIGYGGGYYDRTLAALRKSKNVIALGLAFAAQEVPEVPAMPYDARLDFVLTEREVITCARA